MALGHGRNWKGWRGLALLGKALATRIAAPLGSLLGQYTGWRDGACKMM